MPRDFGPGSPHLRSECISTSPDASRLAAPTSDGSSRCGLPPASQRSPRHDRRTTPIPELAICDAFHLVLCGPRAIKTNLTAIVLPGINGAPIWNPRIRIT